MAEKCKNCNREVGVPGSMFVRGGLCRVCYMHPEMRLFRIAKFRVTNITRPKRAPVMRPLPTPTDWPPGSEEKVKVMIARHAAGQQIFHPDDNRPFPDQTIDDYDSDV